jgi:hypothetical protein
MYSIRKRPIDNNTAIRQMWGDTQDALRGIDSINSAMKDHLTEYDNLLIKLFGTKKVGLTAAIAGVTGIDGTLNAGFIPVSTAPKVLADGPLFVGSLGGVCLGGITDVAAGNLLVSGLGTGWVKATAGLLSSSTLGATGITMATNRILGRGTALSGAAEEMVLSSDYGIGFTYAASSLKINTPQDLQSTSTPQFLRIGVGAAADASMPLYIKKDQNAETLVKIDNSTFGSSASVKLQLYTSTNDFYLTSAYQSLISTIHSKYDLHIESELGNITVTPVSTGYTQFSYLVGIGGVPTSPLHVIKSYSGSTTVTIENTNSAPPVQVNLELKNNAGSTYLRTIRTNAFLITGQISALISSLTRIDGLLKVNSSDTPIAVVDTTIGTADIDGWRGHATNLDHGLTDLVPTTVWGQIRGVGTGTVVGGMLVRGFSSNASQTGLELAGIIGYNDTTDTTPAVLIRGSKKNTTSDQALGAAETVFQVNNYTTTLLTILGNGNTEVAGTLKSAGLVVGATPGIDATIALAKLTAGGANGSATYVKGILTSYTAPT